MRTSSTVFYVVLMAVSGCLVIDSTGSLGAGIAVICLMVAIGLVVDCLNEDVKDNGKMLKKIQEKLGIEEEKK